MTKHPKYQDYVIRDGRLVGDFEAMYRDFEDPWSQAVSERFASDKAIGLNLLQRLRHEKGVARVVEVGCGLGGYSRRLREAGFDVIGIDVSSTAIEKARLGDPEGRYEVAGLSDHEFLATLAPDAFVMAEVSWYVLPYLRPFLQFIASRLPETFVYHTLTLYPPGQQVYGREFFTSEEEIRRYFGMRYLEWGETHLGGGMRRAYFLGTWRAG